MRTRSVFSGKSTGINLRAAIAPSGLPGGGVPHAKRSRPRLCGGRIIPSTPHCSPTSRGHKGASPGPQPTGVPLLWLKWRRPPPISLNETLSSVGHYRCLSAVAAHRLVLNNSARSQGLSREEAALQILAEAKAPALHLEASPMAKYRVFYAAVVTALLPVTCSSPVIFSGWRWYPHLFYPFLPAADMAGNQELRRRS